jgi:hypothetical protein
MDHFWGMIHIFNDWTNLNFVQYNYLHSSLHCKKFNHEISTEIFYKVYSSTENTVLEIGLKIAIFLSFKERQLYKLDFYQCWVARIIAVIKPTVIMWWRGLIMVPKHLVILGLFTVYNILYNTRHNNFQIWRWFINFCISLHRFNRIPLSFHKLMYVSPHIPSKCINISGYYKWISVFLFSFNKPIHTV